MFADAADSDVDGDPLSVSAVNGAGGNVGIPVAGAYGSLTLLANGTYTYELDDANPNVNALQIGDTPLTDSFTYTVTDPDGKTASSTVTISIFGNNDAPVASADTNWIQELMVTDDATDNSVVGDVLSNVVHSGAPSGAFADVADTDVDGDLLTVVAVNGVGGNVGQSVAGTYGKLTLLANGTYSYELDDSLSVINVSAGR